MKNLKALFGNKKRTLQNFFELIDEYDLQITVGKGKIKNSKDYSNYKRDLVIIKNEFNEEYAWLPGTNVILNCL